MEKWWNCDWHGITNVLGKNITSCPRATFFHNKSHMDFSGNQNGKLTHSYISYENFIPIKLNCYS